MEFLEKFALLGFGLVLVLVAVYWFLVALAPIKTKKEKWIANLGFGVILLVLFTTGSPIIPENPWQRAILLITIVVIVLAETFKARVSRLFKAAVVIAGACAYFLVGYLS